MSAPQNKQEVPAPDSDWMREHEADAPVSRSLTKMARLWRPVGTFFETAVATISRYAHRLIDRTTGKAYSADELEAKILAAVGGGGPHTHTGADITDLTNNAVLNPGKPLRGSNGMLDGPLTLPEVRVSGFGYTMTVGPVANMLTHSGNTYYHTHPFATGIYLVGPPFPDSAAANAAVAVGDVWWDTTANKPRVRLS